MKSIRCGLVWVVLGIIIGFLLSGALIEKGAVAQTDRLAAPPAGSPRFQISAWAVPIGSEYAARAEQGCYIVNTATGELWLAIGDGSPKRISDRLH